MFRFKWHRTVLYIEFPINGHDSNVIYPPWWHTYCNHHNLVRRPRKEIVFSQSCLCLSNCSLNLVNITVFNILSCHTWPGGSLLLARVAILAGYITLQSWPLMWKPIYKTEQCYFLNVHDNTHLCSDTLIISLLKMDEQFVTLEVRTAEWSPPLLLLLLLLISGANRMQYAAVSEQRLYSGHWCIKLISMITSYLMHKSSV